MGAGWAGTTLTLLPRFGTVNQRLLGLGRRHGRREKYEDAEKNRNSFCPHGFLQSRAILDQIVRYLGAGGTGPRAP